MGGDDLEVGEGRGRRVEPDRASEVDADSLAARLAGTDAAGTRMEQGDKPELLALLVERPVLLLIGREGLQRRVELHALEPELRDAIELGDRAVAFEWVDTAEADE